MSTHKVIISLFIAVTVVGMILIIPSLDHPVSAEQSLYTGNENHDIPLQDAVGLTQAYRLAGSSESVLAHYFGKTAIEKALAQPGCVGVRMFYGKHKDGSSTLVIIGVDRSGNDMTSGIALQKAVPCPPACGDAPSELQREKTFATLK
jgi:hypothetical protein